MLQMGASVGIWLAVGVVALVAGMVAVHRTRRALGQPVSSHGHLPMLSHSGARPATAPVAAGARVPLPTADALNADAAA